MAGLSAEEKYQTVITSSDDQSEVPPLTISFVAESSHLGRAVITVSPQLICEMRNHVIGIYQQSIRPRGIETKSVSTRYIVEEYGTHINESLSRYILKHYVIDFLNKNIETKKILVANTPRLSIISAEENTYRYHFELSLHRTIELKEWRAFNFKPPKRKLYKDLDKQVELFLDREYEKPSIVISDKVQNNDWVFFELMIVGDNGKILKNNTSSSYWLKICTKYVTSAFQESFINKKVGEQFTFNNLSFEEGLDDYISPKLTFLVKIRSVSKGNSFVLDAFKHLFKLKNKLDVHKKLIEVFSYRNDLSQRKSIIEELFHVFFSKHRFEIPKHHILRKEEDILTFIKKLPDYHVYKSQKNFWRQVSLLAEKQLKEELLVDQIANLENISASDYDVECYLTLFNHERLKEFVYFKPAADVLERTGLPLGYTTLSQAVRREKTLNHLIALLSK